MKRIIRTHCDPCGSDRADLVAHPAAGTDWQLRRCLDCGFVFLADPPDVEAAVAHFPWDKRSGAENKRRDQEQSEIVNAGRRQFARLKRGARSLLRRDKVASLARTHFKAGRVIDLGCGRGSRVRSLPEWCQPTGIELSEAHAAVAQEAFARRGGEVIMADALSGLQSLESDAFTGVLARSFLEHEIRPLEVLREIRRVLRPGGRLILKVPNYGSLNRCLRGDNWCGFRLPDHVNYFAPQHLRALFDRSSLNVVRFGWLDRLPTSDNMWCVAEKP